MDVVTETVRVFEDLKIQPGNLTWVQAKIIEKCLLLMRTLLQRNLQYGNSFLHPVQVFSRCDALQTLDLMLDQKLARVAAGPTDNASRADSTLDNAGYSLLRLIIVDWLGLTETGRQEVS